MFNQVTDGWYSYYTIDLMRDQLWIYYAFITFWSEDFFIHLPIAGIFGLVFFVNIYHTDRIKFYQWLALFLGAFFGSFLTRVKVGGYDNVLLPLFAIMSILFGMGLNELLYKKGIPLSLGGSWSANIVLFACLIQFTIVMYNPFAQIPGSSDRTAGNELLGLITSVEGDVFLPDHAYLSRLAGKSTYAHEGAIWDVLRGGDSNLGKEILSDDLNRAIQQQKFDVIILDTDWNVCCKEINNYYTLSGNVFDDEDVFYTVTGRRIRPTFIYTAKRLVDD